MVGVGAGLEYYLVESQVDLRRRWMSGDDDERLLQPRVQGRAQQQEQPTLTEP